MIGLTLSFAYMNDKTWQNTEYSSCFAKVNGNKKSIGVLSHWFKVEGNENLCFVEMSVHGYTAIQNYRLTLQAPKYTNLGLRFSDITYEVVKEKLEKEF